MRLRNPVFLCITISGRSFILASTGTRLLGASLECDRCDLDAADTLSCLKSNLYIAVIAPGVTPTVLDEEVLHTIFFTVAYN